MRSQLKRIKPLLTGDKIVVTKVTREGEGEGR